MTPNEIQNKSFERKGMGGGYRAEEVDLFLGQIAAYVQRLEDEKKELLEKMAVLAEKIEEYREDEQSLRAALIGAQKLGDSVVRDAKKKAEAILGEANRKAGEIIGDARSNIDREALTLSRMQGQVAEFKAQILNMYQKHIENLKAIPEELSIPDDMREVVDHSIAKAQARVQTGRAVKERGEKVESFVIAYDDVEIPVDVVDNATEESDQAPSKPKRDFGELKFGEEYSLTRDE